jgi:iron complex transport system permease protein
MSSQDPMLSTRDVVRRQAGKPALWLCVLIGLSVLGVGVGCWVGSTGWTPIASGLPWQGDGVDALIVWEIRLPRSLGAWAGGALLALAGAVAQGLFRNPLADPYLLGSASGASLGWMLGLLAAGQGAMQASLWQRLGLTGAAFVGALLAVLLTMLLARGVQHTLRLLLGGVIVGVMLGAVTALLGFWRPELLLAMQGFMLGSTAFIGGSSALLMLSVLCLCVLGAWAAARALDALTLGAATAQSLGVSLGRYRLVLLAVFALATATAVAQMGLVAFIGLAAPHAVRVLVSVTHRWLLWLSVWMGGVLLLWADLLARGLWAPQEMPVGILTAVLGGGYLLLLMFRQRGTGGV